MWRRLLFISVLFLSNGQYTQALALVNALPQTHTLSEKEALDYPAYQNWYTLRAQLAEGNHTWFDADSTQRATLHTLADTANHNAPMLWANHALKLIGEDVAYREPIYLPNPVSQKTSTQFAASNARQQELVKIYPNPASNVLNIVVKGAVTGQVVLIDLTGKLVLQTELSYGTAVLNVKNLTPGVYIARIYVDNEELETIKVLVAGE